MPTVEATEEGGYSLFFCLLDSGLLAASGFNPWRSCLRGGAERRGQGRVFLLIKEQRVAQFPVSIYILVPHNQGGFFVNEQRCRRDVALIRDVPLQFSHSHAVPNGAGADDPSECHSWCWAENVMTGWGILQPAQDFPTGYFPARYVVGRESKRFFITPPIDLRKNLASVGGEVGHFGIILGCNMEDKATVAPPLKLLRVVTGI